jgi:hypothetical protein
VSIPTTCCSCVIIPSSQAGVFGRTAFASLLYKVEGNNQEGVFSIEIGLKSGRLMKKKIYKQLEKYFNIDFR